MSIIDITPTPQPKQKKAKRKKPSMKELFGEIWDERIHLCCNCYGHLGNLAKAWFFSHNKPKSTHPELKYDKKNIDLRCWACHSFWDAHKLHQYEQRTGQNAGKDCSGFGVNCP